ncbi:dehydrogenase [Paenibacillus alkalitolerans]|uniref:dehydrogenase n=1 Tax=Paenibacillus alkalitolerans TaxID=2799335 RepID=UPI0018F37350|nr:dehydrogenase [Paenibacillus alkalitolerans]
MKPNEKHKAPLPSPRGIRRACSRELYRTVKRLGVYIPPERLTEAEELYFKKVVGNLIYIFEHRDNKKKQADWWEEHVAPDIAKLWQIDEGALVRAFRSGYGG